jgi:hypothetical protein
MSKHITPGEFAAAACIARLSPERIAVARAVLVEGKTYVEAVAPYGWSRQSAQAPVKSILEHLARYKAARDAEAAATPAPASPPAMPEAP